MRFTCVITNKIPCLFENDENLYDYVTKPLDFLHEIVVGYELLQFH